MKDNGNGPAMNSTVGGSCADIMLILLTAAMRSVADGRSEKTVEVPV